MFGFFNKKKVVKRLEEDVQKSFASVKEDFGKVGEWIRHLDGKHDKQSGEVEQIKMQILEIRDALEDVNEFISFFGQGLSKQPQTAVHKQPQMDVVQTPVQTAVQTDILANLTVMERAIVWALLNSEMKLSYEDLSALLGKNKSTIRGQINTIKQKREGLILESRENNGKKRLYIPNKMRGFVLKSVKVRVKALKKGKIKVK